MPPTNVTQTSEWVGDRAGDREWGSDRRARREDQHWGGEVERRAQTLSSSACAVARPPFSAAHSPRGTTPWPSISCRTGVRGRGLSNKVPCLPLATEQAPDPTQTNRIPTPNPSPSSWKQEGRKEATPTFRLLLRLAMPPGSWGWSPPPPTALATLKHPCPPL